MEAEKSKAKGPASGEGLLSGGDSQQSPKAAQGIM